VIDPDWSEHKAKLRRGKSREAISLALQGRWEKASEVNRGILQLFPDDVEALNRLGKACLELGRYSDAREAFEGAARLAPYNTITKKNLERLAHLQEAVPPPKQGKVVTPYLFIEESGKSGTMVLDKPAAREVLARMAAGDVVKLVCRDHALVVENYQGEYLGQMEPKLGIRLVRLIKGGNRYDAAIISINRQEISVIIWETYRHPDLGSVCSLPTRSKEGYKGYWRDALLRYDLGGEMEEDEEFASEWREGYTDGGEASDGDEPSEPRYAAKSARASEDDLEE
jgi:hypothetical protein